MGDPKCLVSRIGLFFGKLVGGDEKDLAELKKGFEKFFNSVRELGFDFQFSAELEDGKLITRSKCPVYRYYRRWCEGNCLEFVEGFVRAFGDVRAKRVSKQPESDHCVFEFEVIKNDG